MKDDDEEEENTFGVTRYPCMPSLVALQQMRNRLHLAFLGRKLMKWTALATGKELRRLGAELYEVYDGFSDDMRNAFILLARSRYYYPQLNNIVTEDIATKAAVLVHQTSRPVSSVKVIQFEIVETGYPPYEHLGIDKGGYTIMETKKAWLELLKKIIMMMQLRTSFLTVEQANKNATKKMNVIKKIVLPRTNVTIGYILTELEEMEREEFHRLKKIKEKKKRDSDLSKECATVSDVKFGHPCGICDNIMEKFNNGDNLVRIKSKNKSPATLTIESEFDKKLTSVVTGEIKELYVSSSTTSASKPLRNEISAHNNNILDCLKLNLNDLIVCGKELLQIGSKNVNVNEFIKTCDKTKLKLDQYFKVEERPHIGDADLKQKLEYLKAHLHKVIDITKEVQAKVTLSTSVENFIHVCQDVGENLNIYEQPISVTLEQDHKNKLDQLRDIISNVRKITNEYKKQGMFSQDVDEFLKSCDTMNSKLVTSATTDDCLLTGHDKAMLNLKQVIKSDNVTDENLGKLEHLKYHLREVIDTAKEFKPNLKLSPSVENFVGTCQEVDKKLHVYKESELFKHKENNSNRLEELRDIISNVTKTIGDFKNKAILSTSVEKFLESYNKDEFNIDKCPETATDLEKCNIRSTDLPIIQRKGDVETETIDLHNLIQRINEVIYLGMKAREECVISKSIENIIQVFKKIKDQFELESKQPKVIVSLEDLIHSCENKKDRMDVDNMKISSIRQNSDPGSMFECGQSCICKRDSKTDLTEANHITQYIEEAPCDLCILDIKEPSEESICIAFSNSRDREPETNRTSLTIISSEPSVCDYCKNLISEEKESRRDSVDTENSLGYFENKMQKKVKVTRRQDMDGAVWEEKETITIRKIKHDPNKVSLSDDEDDSSDEYLNEGN